MVPAGKVDFATKEQKIKSLCVKEYNKNRGLVDKYDSQISFSERIHLSIKWHKKLLFHLVDLIIYNAYVLYKLKNNVNHRLATFQLQLI